jgi:hypothetical protein
MNTHLLDTKFSRIGARLKVADRPSRGTRTAGVISLDVQSDRLGEFFEIVQQPGAEAEVAVLDVQPADRHLLLLVRENGEKHKFLCGHDERHWFVAGIPETAPVGTVRQAKEALKPAEVQTAQARKRLKAKVRNRRKNAAFVRQGEWFFLPAPDFAVNEKLVLPNEPLRRGGGKPIGPSSATAPAARRSTSAPATPTALPKRSTRASWPAARRRRAGAGAPCGGTLGCTSRATSGTLTTQPSPCTAGIRS